MLRTKNILLAGLLLAAGVSLAAGCGSGGNTIIQPSPGGPSNACDKEGDTRECSAGND